MNTHGLSKPELRVLRAILAEPGIEGLTLKERGILGRVNLRSLRTTGAIVDRMGGGWEVTPAMAAILKGEHPVSTDRERQDLDKAAQELADALGIDPEYVQVEYPTNRISVSVKQAKRIVAMLTGDR